MRIPWSNLPPVLCLIGGVALAEQTAGFRQEQSSYYRGHVDYNRTLMASLHALRADLQEGTVGILGVDGLSPWSHHTGDYIANQIGGRARWHVYVPQANIFYTPSEQLNGLVQVSLEDHACLPSGAPPAPAAPTKYLVVAPDGTATPYPDCQTARAHLAASIRVDTWGPQRVSAAAAGAGFALWFNGNNLGRTQFRIGGQVVDRTIAQGGRLMTLSVPVAASAGRDRVPFSIVDVGGRPIYQGQVQIQ